MPVQICLRGSSVHSGMGKTLPSGTVSGGIVISAVISAVVSVRRRGGRRRGWYPSGGTQRASFASPRVRVHAGAMTLGEGGVFTFSRVEFWVYVSRLSRREGERWAGHYS